MVVLLVPNGGDGPSLGPDTLRQLAAVGVTDLAVLRDQEFVALVLQGWAFDPERSAPALQTLVARSENAKTLFALSQAPVSAAPAGVHRGEEET